MGLLPKIYFVKPDDPYNQWLLFGYYEAGDGVILRRDGTYHVFSDTIYIFDEGSSILKLRSLVHELGHAFAFRIPFHWMREPFNWVWEKVYSKGWDKTLLSDYLSYYMRARDAYGRFPWLRPMFKGLKECMEAWGYE